MDSAFFFLVAKNVPKAVQGLKASLSGLTQQIRNLKSLLRGGGGAANLAETSGNLLASFNDIIANARNLYGKSANEVAKILGEGWTRGNYGKTGTGWKFTKGDKIVFYHEGGRHVGPYYGYSSAMTGRVKIVGPGYEPLPGDKAIIISGE